MKKLDKSEKKIQKERRKKAKKVKSLMRKKEKRRDPQNEKQYVESLLPVVAKDEQTEAFYMEDGTLVDMFAIITKDLNSASSDELTFDKYLWEKLYKTYADDLKIIGLYFHPDTSEQQSYMDELLGRTESPVLRRIIKEKKEELAFVGTEDVYMEMQFYLLFFAKNKTDYREKVINIYSLLNQGFLPSIETVSQERKIQIFYQLLNKNMRGSRE